MSAGDGRTIEPRIRISRHGGGSARCSGSRAPAPPRNSCRAMLPSTTLSTSNAISPQPKRTTRFAPRRWTRDGPQPQPRNLTILEPADASRAARQRDKGRRRIARRIVDKGADYVLALKGNQTSLHEDAALFFADPVCARRLRGGRGRRRRPDRRAQLPGRRGDVARRTPSRLERAALHRRRHR